MATCNVGSIILTLCLIALGANGPAGLTANARIVSRAALAMPGRVVACSRLYRTPAWPPGAGPDFVNAALALDQGRSLGNLLDKLHGMEARAGRVRGIRWAARALDLDLLASGGRISPDPHALRYWLDLGRAQQAEMAPRELILPHPRLQDRAFVLIPLMDVAPDWRHPATGRTVRAMAASLPGAVRREIRAIGPIGGVVNRKLRA